jgi:hypothetical protein
MPPRDDDKVQARQRVNVEVKAGRRPHPNALPCTDCGHVWKPGERRHEYDHHLGYAAEHHLHVQAVCTTCHARRSEASPTCQRGHAWSEDNTMVTPQGRRVCRACRRLREAGRRERKAAV